MFELGFVSIVSNTKDEHVGCLVIWVLNPYHIKDLLHMFRKEPYIWPYSSFF